MRRKVVAQSIIARNISALEGIGVVGAEFKKALQSSSIQSGCQYLEALIDRSSGEIVEFLANDPQRIYPQQLINDNGLNIVIGNILSTRNPRAALCVITYCVHSACIIAVAWKTFLSAEVMQVVKASTEAFNNKDFGLAA